MIRVATITVNPAIDKSASVQALIAEKKLQCKNPVSEPGGGGINVSRALKKLGIESHALFLSGGRNGELLENLLSYDKINIQAVKIVEETRENFTIHELSTNHQYRFGMPGPQVNYDEWHRLLEEIDILKDLEYVVTSGSLSPGIPEDFFARIATICNSKNIKLIIDTSGKALKLAVNEGVYLLKPNLAELAFLAGKEEISGSEVESIAKELINKYKCKIVITSMGASGAMLITKTMVKLISAPCVKVKSTVGAGDSMVAGIIAALLRGYTIYEAAKYGVASGTAATMNPGTQLCDLCDVEKLYNQIQHSV